MLRFFLNSSDSFDCPVAKAPSEVKISSQPRGSARTSSHPSLRICGSGCGSVSIMLILRGCGGVRARMALRSARDWSCRYRAAEAYASSAIAAVAQQFERRDTGGLAHHFARFGIGQRLRRILAVQITVKAIAHVGQQHRAALHHVELPLKPQRQDQIVKRRDLLVARRGGQILLQVLEAFFPTQHRDKTPPAG